jgi:hypothetical protein
MQRSIIFSVYKLLMHHAWLRRLCTGWTALLSKGRDLGLVSAPGMLKV